jgi:predicted acyltransferase
MSTPIENRHLALDVLRGMTVCFMIVVNSPGPGAAPFSPLEHAAWHGFTPTDLVFPTFLFVVGNAMAFTQPRLQGLATGAFLAKTFRRTLLIFLLGYLMYWFPFVRQGADGSWSPTPISHTRILGVLQRIALCYAIAALMVRFLPPRALRTAGALLLAGYWAALAWGGDYSMTGNLGHRIDTALLGDNHLYHGEGVAFDPEGLLSTLPAVVNVLIGYLAGRFVREKGASYETIARLALAGASLVAVAYFWNNLFPINKKLWTSPFVLYTCGLDLLLLAALVKRTEMAQPPRWTAFFTVFGRNPLAIYLLSEIVLTTLWTVPGPGGNSLCETINAAFFQRIAPGPWGSLLFALSLMMGCWLVGWAMDRRKVYIRV